MAVYRYFLIFILLIASLDPLGSAPLISTITYFPGPVPLTEEVIRENKDRKIVRFDIIGVKRENRHVIRSIIDLKAGDYLASLDLRRIRTQLDTTGLLSQSGLFFRPNREGYIITLRVKEKEERIALPFFSLSESEVHTGGAFFTASPFDLDAPESDSRIWQAGGIKGSINYINPHFQGQAQRMEIIITGSQPTRYHSWANAENIRQFRGYSANLDMNWSFRTDLKLIPTILLYYDLFEVDELWGENLNPPVSNELVSTGFEIVLRDYYFLHFFDDGFQTSLRAAQKYLLDENRSLISIHLSSDWNTNPIYQHRLHLGFRGGYNPSPPVVLEFLRGSGHFLLPSNRAVDRLYISGTVEYEVPLHRNPWGTATAFSFVETGLYSPQEDEYQMYYGPGLGIHLYVHGLSSPVVGAALGINLDQNYFASSFFAGIQF